MPSLASLRWAACPARWSGRCRLRAQPVRLGSCRALSPRRSVPVMSDRRWVRQRDVIETVAADARSWRAVTICGVQCTVSQAAALGVLGRRRG